MANQIFARAACASSVLSSFYSGDKLDLKAVASATGAIGRAGAKLDTQIHATAVACIVASLPHEEGGYLNAEPARQLLNAMPKGSRAKALAAWFEAFSNVRLRREEKGWTVKMVGPANKMYVKADPDAAMAKPFWSVEEQGTDPKAFTLGAALASLLRKAEAAAKEGKLSPEDAEVVAALRKAGGKVLPKVDA